MKKNEFLNLLKNKLQVLEEDEVKDILEEYENTEDPVENEE